MCMCAKPNINGQRGYSWNTPTVGVRPVAPPDIQAGDELLADEPGRCGRGLDSHCHHFRLVKRGPLHLLLVRHGGGDESLTVSKPAVQTLLAVASDDRYWLCQALFSASRASADQARNAERHKWQTAIAAKRVKTRKRRGVVTVSIDSQPLS